MATPSLKFVEPTIAEGDRVLAPEPVEIYGLPTGDGGTPSFSELTGSVSDASGANLQAILEDLASRLAAVEG